MMKIDFVGVLVVEISSEADLKPQRLARNMKGALATGITRGGNA